jgi:hypothetical protein
MARIAGGTEMTVPAVAPGIFTARNREMVNNGARLRKLAAKLSKIPYWRCICALHA